MNSAIVGLSGLFWCSIDGLFHSMDGIRYSYLVGSVEQVEGWVNSTSERVREQFKYTNGMNHSIVCECCTILFTDSKVTRCKPRGSVYFPSIVAMYGCACTAYIYMHIYVCVCVCIVQQLSALVGTPMLRSVGCLEGAVHCKTTHKQIKQKCCIY